MHRSSFFMLLFTAGLVVIFNLPSSVFGQTLTQTPTASPSADLDTIKENVIKRIQEVVASDKSNSTTKDLTAIYGTLSSITANTISIDTPQSGVQLASTSAQTTYVRLPGNTSIKFDDLVIDEYLVAIGYPNESNVLDTTHIITQKSPPKPPTLSLSAGFVTNYDTKTYDLAITTNDNQNLTFLIGRKTQLFVVSPDGSKSPIIRTADIPENSHLLLIYEPVDEGDTPVPSEVLVQTPFPYVTPAEIAP